MARFIVGCELLSPDDRDTLRKLTRTFKDVQYRFEAAVIREDNGHYKVTWWHVPSQGDNSIQWVKSNRSQNRITARRWLQERDLMR